MKPIELEFLSKGILEGGIFLLPVNDALQLVRCCRERGIRVLGLDAFWLFETTIQPVMDMSMDYSWPNDENSWSCAESFLSEHANSGLYFEVVVDQEQATVLIHVSILRNGARVWQGVQAEHLHDNVYRILPQRYDHASESWQFEPGDTVACQSVESADGLIIAAFKRLDS